VASPAFSQYDDYDDYDDYDEGYDYGGETAWFTLKQVAHPWYFGIIGGFTQNTLYMGGAENYRPTQKWVGSNGGTIALAARYQIFNWLAVQAEPTYITKNYSSKWVGVYEGKAYDNITNGFVDFPLLVNLSAGWGSGNGVFRVFANVGGFAGFWAHGRGDGVEPVMPNLNPIYGQGDDFYAYDTSYEFDDRRDNRFDGGLLFGGGIQYDTNAFSIIAEFRYSYSLTDLQKKYQSVDFVPQMNDTWMLTAGVLFNPGIFFGGK
jgi:hypothetical protein